MCVSGKIDNHADIINYDKGSTTVKEDVEITVRIVTAFLSRNEMRPSCALEFVEKAYKEVQRVFYTQPASDDLVECMCCGKRMRTLRKHLRAQHNLSVEEYLEKFKLPRNTPLIAKSYSRTRSDAAKQGRLGMDR